MWIEILCEVVPFGIETICISYERYGTFPSHLILPTVANANAFAITFAIASAIAFAIIFAIAFAIAFAITAATWLIAGTWHSRIIEKAWIKILVLN